VEAVRRVVSGLPVVRAVWVFGSRARGDGRPDSDLDLGILYRRPQPVETSLDLEARFERAVGAAVDVVDVARASAFLALDVIRGDRIVDRDPDDTDRFEIYVLRRAGDLFPYELARQALVVRSDR
jgi:predicted nucleotidyltransferase